MKITEPAQELPVFAKVDVVVCGGGPGGWPAAITAARSGARTLLVEQHAFLGGMNTLSIVNQWDVKDIAAGLFEERPLIGGPQEELTGRMVRDRATVDPKLSYDHRMFRDLRYDMTVLIDMHMLKINLFEMCVEAGVDLLLHTQTVKPIMDGTTIKGVIIENKGGRQAVLADIVVDATGDADIAARAGAPFEQDTTPCGCTMVWIVGNVDIDRFRPYHNLPRMAELMERAIANGDLPQPEFDETGAPRSPWKTLSTFPKKIFSTPLPYGIGLNIFDPPAGYHDRFARVNEVRVWGVHVTNVDATDPVQLTRAEVFARQRVRTITDFLRKYVPGFEQSYIVDSAVRIGVRESRRIVGEYMLTDKDIREGARFDDVVARSCMDYFPEGYGAGVQWGPIYDIPYRVTVPLKVDNLLVSGRSISHDRVAAKTHSIKFTTTLAGVAQGVGVAAALAARTKVVPRRLDHREVQRLMLKQGANLGPGFEVSRPTVEEMVT